MRPQDRQSGIIKTRRGRVVYDRKRNAFGCSAVLRILGSMVAEQRLEEPCKDKIRQLLATRPVQPSPNEPLAWLADLLDRWIIKPFIDLWPGPIKRFLEWLRQELKKPPGSDIDFKPLLKLVPLPVIIEHIKQIEE